MSDPATVQVVRSETGTRVSGSVPGRRRLRLVPVGHPGTPEPHQPTGGPRWTPAPPGSTGDPGSTARLAKLGGPALLGGLVDRASSRVVRPGADQVLPVLPELRPLLPWPGLRRGATVAIDTDVDQGVFLTRAGVSRRQLPDQLALPAASGGASSLLLSVLAGPLRDGAWAAVVGLPALSPVAAAELGIDLGRLALVPVPGPEWVPVTAALLDGFDVVVVQPPARFAPSVARRLAARARRRGSVLLAFGGWDGAEVVLRVLGGSWQGLGQGRGRLRSRPVTVAATGRGAATRPRAIQVLLPDPAGRLTTLDPDPAPPVAIAV